MTFDEEKGKILRENLACETKRFMNVNNKMVLVTTKRRGDQIEFPPKEVQFPGFPPATSVLIPPRKPVAKDFCLVFPVPWI